MNKPNIIKKLASLYGVKLEYFDYQGKHHKLSYSECLQFLDAIGVNTESSETIEKQLHEIDVNKWKNWLPPVQVIRQPDLPVIKLRIPHKEIKKTFHWVLHEENGNIHKGSFVASDLSVNTYKSIKKHGTFIQIDLPLPVNPEMGYHNLTIYGPNKQEATTKVIIAPKRCYVPKNLKKTRKIKGPKLNFNYKSNNRISNYIDVRNIIKLLSKDKVDTVAIGPINQLTVHSNEKINLNLPSSRMLFNIIFLKINDIIDYLDDKSIQIELLSSEYQENLDSLIQEEKADYNAVYDLKFRVFKLLYQSFRDYSINLNSPKSQEFYTYLNKKPAQIRKLAVYEALHEYFSNEYDEFTSWLDWPEAYQNPDSDVVKQFEKDNKELIEFYEFLQWQADIQIGSAALLSFEKELPVGILVDIPLGVDPKGADAWLRRKDYAFNAKAIPSYVTDSLIKEDEVNFVPWLPHELYESGYLNFVDCLRPNMIHAGAVKIDNLTGLDYSRWFINDGTTDLEVIVRYPFEDMLSILALESQRNNCVVVSGDPVRVPPKIKQALIQYGILSLENFDLKEIDDEEELKAFYHIPKADIDTGYETGDDLLKYQKDEIDVKIPESTYRLQLNRNFTFRDAINIIPYLKKLGVSHCYSSPLLCARSGSMHGYDIIDHMSLNLELGSREDFYEFVDTLHHNNMGLIVDIVPNHMGIGKENLWWMDVLENGSASEYSSYFDIDWLPLKHELAGKVLVPVLGDHYGNILANGELHVKFSKETGKLQLFYYDHEFPINPSSYPAILEHRIELLASRLGSTSPEYLEYQSIITEFKNLPKHTEKDPDKILERIREKDIASKRLSRLCYLKPLIEEFIEENLYDYKCKPDDPVSRRRMHNLLEEQAYRLAYWRVSCDEINYRRFFDVNDLAGVCIDKSVVFTNTHSLIFDLIKERKISGLRIDHPDGLFNPTEYFSKLQSEISNRLDTSFNYVSGTVCNFENIPFYVVAEKILAPYERISEAWAVHGTVGYDFLNALNGLFIKKENESRFTKIYHKYINTTIDFQELVITCKKLIMKTSLTGELNVLANYLNRISEYYYNTRDYTLDSLKDALIEIIAHFPVYRTYITENEKSSQDENYIKWATGAAKKRSKSTDPSIYDFIEKVLLLEFEEENESPYAKDILEFAMKFQQYTGPLMAKGLEDTCFYRYNRLIALNEVGGEPHNFGISRNEFHQLNQYRSESYPHNMLTTSTHDTKRSEDVRARICVLSEIPEEWLKFLNNVTRINRNKKTRLENTFMPDRNDEYLFYQTLIGIWPEHDVKDEELQEIIERLETYMIKALREAKIHTSWVNIDTSYEEAISTFIRKVLNSPKKHPFWKEFLAFHKEIVLRGNINSLSQLLIKLTSPGMPDIYQGNEIFNYSLVDPDNRRPVNYNKNGLLLSKIENIVQRDYISGPDEPIDLSKILENKDINLLKMFLTASTLNFRRQCSHIFKESKYIPLEIAGERSENLIAYARANGNAVILVIAPRLVYNMVSEQNPLPAGESVWQDTTVLLPEELINTNWKCIFTNNKINSENGKLPISKALIQLPFTLLYGSLDR